MSEPYVGQVMIFAFNFAPRNWSYCNGALMAISQNQALFSILGTTYGGDGRVTFALPNIQDKGVMNLGPGPGLSNYALGQTSGMAEVTLTTQQMPAHSHTVSGDGASTATGFKIVPLVSDWIGTRIGATPGARDFMFNPTPTDGANFAGAVISISGGSLPHENEQPYLGMNYCIALFGLFPSRN